MQKDPDLVLDTLRSDLSYITPELYDLRWGIAKKEISGMMKPFGPRKSTVGVVCLFAGAGLGIYGLKWFPKTSTVKHIKYINEALKAQRRLNKIAEEDYGRLDEAMKTEEQFLNMMAQDQHLAIDIGLRVEDGKIRLDFNKKKKAKDE
jgi:hypothetical protein